MADVSPRFTVVIPSRNRTHLLEAAIASVLAQSERDYRIVVVDDGSDSEHAEGYRQLAARIGPVVELVSLPHTPAGHGPSYVINTGAWIGKGKLLAFLDDDDVWTDQSHLEKAREAFESHPDAEAYFTNQVAVHAGSTEEQLLWLGGLQSVLQQDGNERIDGVYRPTVDQLLRAGGFAHLNTMIITRSLFDRVNGLDPNIRWEGDRDFYLRLIDEARGILFNPAVVARHHVPDPTRQDNITTATSYYTRMLSQLDVLNKAALFAKHPGIRAHGRRHKVFTLQRIAQRLASEGRLRDAVYYSSQALLMDGSWKWPFRHARLMWRRLLSRQPDSRERT